MDLGEGISLELREPPRDSTSYPTHRIQRGLILFRQGIDLSGEGVGFGVPVLKVRGDSVFPGSAEISRKEGAGTTTLTVDFELNLVERFFLFGTKEMKLSSMYSLNNFLSRLHREHSVTRGVISGGGKILKRLWKVKTRYVERPALGAVRVTMTCRPDRSLVSVAADFSRLKTRDILEIAMMNEQGAHHFDRYEDSDGLRLEANAIGTWDEIVAGEAKMIAAREKLLFQLRKVEGARMFRGREAVPGRLAWSGIAHVFPGSRTFFDYEISLGSGK